MFTFHLLETTTTTGLRLLARSGRPAAGLRHSEPMAVMELGAPIVSTRRAQSRRLALFARWEDEGSLDAWLGDDPTGRDWAEGWHVRLEFLRRWGLVEALDDLPIRGADHDLDEPVVAVTLARLNLPQVPRFVRWGRPVERQVRDDPATTLALAAGRPPRTVSTFSVWRSARQMEDMVAGRSTGPEHDRHAAAMGERDRHDFHREFTTLRFRCLAEHGAWRGRTGIVPS